MRVATHARRSTDEHQAASLETQLGEAKRFVESRGWTWSEDHIYIEDAVSRAEFKKRPMLLKLLNAAEAKAFDVVVTRDETRLGGDMVRTCLLIQDLLDAGTQLFYYFSGERVLLDAWLKAPRCFPPARTDNGRRTSRRAQRPWRVHFHY